MVPAFARRARLVAPLAVCLSLSACSDDPASAAPEGPGDAAGSGTDAAVTLPDAATSGDARPPDAATPGPTAPDAQVDAGPPFDPSELDFSAFDDALDAYITTNNLRGASAVVVHRDAGELHRKGYGDFSPERVYLIASSSKILSVGVLLRLADQGLVDFDEPVSKYLSEWGDFKTNITLAQMFSNSSGMISLTENPVYLPYLCQYTTGDATLSTCARAIYTATDTADLRPPDTEFHYGGGQWQLAGGVGEVVSKKSWADLIKETYTEPCGTSTLGYTNQYQDATLSTLGLGAVSYPAFFSGDPSTLPVTKNPSVEGGAYVSVGDYGKILLMHLRGGLCGSERVLSSDAVARMQVDRIGEQYDGGTGGTTPFGYGLGWWVDRENEGVVFDPGAYGAVAYLDAKRHYAVFIAVEAGSGGALVAATKSALDDEFDALSSP